MTQGRKSTRTEIHPVAVNEDQVRTDLANVDALPGVLAAIQQNAQALARELAYDGALTVESLEEEIKFYQRRSVEAVLETGKRLLLLKEVAGHGQFMHSLEGLGIGQSLANKLMAATLKFSNSESTTILKLPSLNQGKLLELLVLDDGEIEALNSGEEVRGIQLDDVDCMSVSELRRALRQEKADKEVAVSKVKAAVAGELAAKDRVIADKAKHIAKLVEEKNQAECLTADERAGELERTLANEVLHAVGCLLPIRQAVHHIRALPDCPNGLYVAAQGALDRVLAEVMAIAGDYGIELNMLANLDTEDFSDPNLGETFDGDGPIELEA